MPPHPKAHQQHRREHSSSPYFATKPIKGSARPTAPSTQLAASHARKSTDATANMKDEGNMSASQASDSSEKRKKRRRDKKRKQALTEEIRAKTLGVVEAQRKLSVSPPVAESMPLSRVVTPDNIARSPKVKSKHASPLSKMKSSAPARPTVTVPPADDHRLQLLQRQMEMSSKESRIKQEENETIIARLEKNLEDKIAELAAVHEEGEKMKQRIEEHAKVMEEHAGATDRLKDAIKEAASCLICSDNLKDPHVLSCGHMACKACLLQWFRSPGAYMHPVPNIDASMDLSHRSKVCHVCRTAVVRRPTRVFAIGDILEPLGESAYIPSASQESPLADPWGTTFPPDPEHYKLWDEEDDTWRCLQCLSEVFGGECQGCGIEYSESEGDEGGFELEILSEGASEFDEEDTAILFASDDESEVSGPEASSRLRRRIVRDVHRYNRTAGPGQQIDIEAVDGLGSEGGSDSGSEGDSEVDEHDRRHRRHDRLHRGRSAIGRVLDMIEHGDDAEEEEEGYEDSFIDDEEIEERSVSGSDLGMSDDGSDASGSVGTGAGSEEAEDVEFSDELDSDDALPIRQPSRRRERRTRITSPSPDAEPPRVRRATRRIDSDSD